MSREPPDCPGDHPCRTGAKVRILARVAAGETVAAICRDEAMPCAGSVQVWRRGDAAFAAALAQARARGELARRGLVFDPAVAAAFLDRMANGARVMDLLARPGMPSQAAYRLWRRTNAEFQAETWRLARVKTEVRAQMRTAGIAGGGGRPYRAFDQAVADQILVRVVRGEPMRRMLETDPALPCRVVVYRWRAEQPQWDRVLKVAIKVGRRARERSRSLEACTPDLLEEIGTQVAMGASLRSLGAEADMPCPATLYRWVAKNPAFATKMRGAEDWRDMMLNDQMLEICERIGTSDLAAVTREAAALRLRAMQLSKRPGWKRARRAEAEGRAERERDERVHRIGGL